MCHICLVQVLSKFPSSCTTCKEQAPSLEFRNSVVDVQTCVYSYLLPVSVHNFSYFLLMTAPSPKSEYMY